MKLRPLLRQLAATLALATLASTAAAQALDSPRRIVVGYTPGGASDRVARILSDKLATRLGVAVLVDNKPGASGNLAASDVYRQSDSHRLLVANTSFTINPHTFNKLPYDPDKDFASVTTFLGATMVLAVHAGIPVNNLPEFVTWTKANPGKVSFASSGTGSAAHLTSELLKSLTKTFMVHIPYRGAAPALRCRRATRAHCMCQPWLTVRLCPVSALVSNAARNRATFAISSTVVNSVSTVSFSMIVRTTSSSRMPNSCACSGICFSTSGVRTKPGQITFARTRFGPPSLATTRARPSRPCLAVT